MSGHFLTDLEVLVVHDYGVRPLLRVRLPFKYQSGLVGEVIVPVGFEFDGATIPRFGMLFIGWPGLRAACIHDYLLACIAKGLWPLSRETADLVFAEALEACGVPEQTVRLMTMAVQAYTAQLRQQMAEESNADDKA